MKSTYAAVAALCWTLCAQDKPIVLKTGMLLDGKGGVQRNVSVVVQNGKIQKIEASATGTVIDLKNVTLLPGMIDTHVHIAWHFGPDGRY